MNSHAPKAASADEVLATLNTSMRGALAERLGITFEFASSERVVASMPVEGNTQPMGLLHGGASAALAETVGSVAAVLSSPPERVPVGVELSCTHHRSARSGRVVAVATPLSVGRTLATYDIVISDDSDRRICTARLTCFFITASA